MQEFCVMFKALHEKSAVYDNVYEILESAGYDILSYGTMNEGRYIDFVEVAKMAKPAVRGDRKYCGECRYYVADKQTCSFVLSIDYEHWHKPAINRPIPCYSNAKNDCERWERKTEKEGETCDQAM